MKTKLSNLLFLMFWFLPTLLWVGFFLTSDFCKLNNFTGWSIAFMFYTISIGYTSKIDRLEERVKKLEEK